MTQAKSTGRLLPRQTLKQQQVNLLPSESSVIVTFFIHLENVLLQNRFTCYQLVSTSFIQAVLDVQVSCVVDADLEITKDALTAVFAQLDFITI